MKQIVAKSSTLPRAAVACIVLSAAARADVADLDRHIASLSVAAGQATDCIAWRDLIASTSVEVAPSGSLDFVAGAKITLQPGFRAQAGSSFSATLDAGLLALYQAGGASASADPDADSIPNAAEETLDSDPLSPNAIGSAPSFSIESPTQQ